MNLNAEILFFYRASHPFSNFYPSKFVVDGLPFHWAEQYIMYRKALHFDDSDSAEKVMQAFSPADCKKLGRQVRGFDEASWARVREQVAFDTVLHKFQNNRKLRDVLLQTGSALLVEAAPADRIWGIGYSEQDAMAYRFQWGENLLGLSLMRVRDVLRAQEV